MANYAKAQLTRRAPQVAGYAAVAGALTANRIYRVELWFGPAAAVPVGVNHEILVVTGANDAIAYFEPNFGFFEATHPASNNRQALEHHVNLQYAAGGDQAANFGYRNVRSIAAATPKGG